MCGFASVTGWMQSRLGRKQMFSFVLLLLEKQCVMREATGTAAPLPCFVLVPLVWTAWVSVGNGAEPQAVTDAPSAPDTEARTTEPHKTQQLINTVNVCQSTKLGSHAYTPGSGTTGRAVRQNWGLGPEHRPGFLILVATDTLSYKLKLIVLII